MTNFPTLAGHTSTWVRDSNTSVLLTSETRSTLTLVHTVVGNRHTEAVVAVGVIWADDVVALSGSDALA